MSDSPTAKPMHAYLYLQYYDPEDNRSGGACGCGPCSIWVARNKPDCAETRIGLRRKPTNIPHAWEIAQCLPETPNSASSADSPQ